MPAARYDNFRPLSMGVAAQLVALFNIPQCFSCEHWRQSPENFRRGKCGVDARLRGATEFCGSFQVAVGGSRRTMDERK